MFEHIQVEFDETREVIIDDTPSGNNTGEVIDVEPGSHTISLAGQKNFTPEQQHINPSGTNPLDPLVVRFDKE